MRSITGTMGWGTLVLIVLLTATSCMQAPAPEDGMLIHVTSGADDPHRVLMALSMASMMADGRPVLVYFDIDGIEAVLADAPDLEYAHFASLHAALATLREKDVPLLACPGCLKAAGKGPADLAEGVEVAAKDRFFAFTTGRVVTLDY